MKLNTPNSSIRRVSTNQKTSKIPIFHLNSTSNNPNPKKKIENQHKIRQSRAPAQISESTNPQIIHIPAPTAPETETPIRRRRKAAPAADPPQPSRTKKKKEYKNCSEEGDAGEEHQHRRNPYGSRRKGDKGDGFGRRTISGGGGGGRRWRGMKGKLKNEGATERMGKSWSSFYFILFL